MNVTVKYRVNTDLLYEKTIKEWSDYFDDPNFEGFRNYEEVAKAIVIETHIGNMTEYVTSEAWEVK
jgi:hypothetical protein